MKKIILTILIFVLSTNVHATTNVKKEATVRKDFSLSVNDIPTKLSNDIIVINGVSYLPIKEIAKLLDVEVSFKEGVINLNTNIDNSINITLIENKLIGIEESISHVNSTITLIENNIKSRIDRGISTEEAEKELLIKKNDIIELEKQRKILTDELEVLNNGSK